MNEKYKNDLANERHEIDREINAAFSEIDAFIFLQQDRYLLERGKMVFQIEWLKAELAIARMYIKEMED